MRFEWDDEKDRLNQQKHGVSFDVAAEIFDDKYYLLEKDRVDEAGEQRWRAIGAVWNPLLSAVLLVIHVYRENRYGEETIRIVSARQADSKDLRRYQKQAID